MTQINDLITDFFLSIIPPTFAILTALCSSSAQSGYLKKSISDIIQRDGIDSKIEDLLRHVSNSSVTLVSFVTTIFSCLLSLIIIFLQFPKEYSILCGASIFVVIVLVFQRWIWEIFSLHLDEISRKTPKKSKATSGREAFHKLTYAQLFTRRQYYFNMFIITLMLIGFLNKLINELSSFYQ